MDTSKSTKPTKEQLVKDTIHAFVNMTDKYTLDQYLLKLFHDIDKDKNKYREIYMEAVAELTDEEETIAFKNLEELSQFGSKRPCYQHEEHDDFYKC